MRLNYLCPIKRPDKVLRNNTALKTPGSFGEIVASLKRLNFTGAFSYSKVR